MREKFGTRKVTFGMRSTILLIAYSLSMSRETRFRALFFPARKLMTHCLIFPVDLTKKHFGRNS